MIIQKKVNMPKLLFYKAFFTTKIFFLVKSQFEENRTFVLFIIYRKHKLNS